MGYGDFRRFAERFWEWRLATSFRTSDDIPRVDHPFGWMPEFDEASIAARRETCRAYLREWRGFDPTGFSVGEQVDYRLLGSALHRVLWEIDTLRSWEADAVFLLSQVLGPWFDHLVDPAPFSEPRERGLIEICRAIPARLDVARANLERAGVGSLARAARADLVRIGERFLASARGLRGYVSEAASEALERDAAAAAEALEAFDGFLAERADAMAPAEPVGRDRFVWYLANVALLPVEPEELVRAAEQDYRRAVMSELVVKNRFREHPMRVSFASAAEQVATQREMERAVREFLVAEGLLSQPDTLGRYHIAEMPPYLAPITWLGVTDDLTSDSRLTSDAVSYCPDPSPELPYFYVANAMDPRLGIIHEGAHYKQLALSWAHENPIRRRYYDSVPNEGIAFYNEELMLLSGLFADMPASQAVIHNFNRLRSLRVIADINLATGVFSVDEATRHFVDSVPMDEETARQESALYAATPGLAMSYHVGKMQLLRLLADAYVAQGERFSLQGFHDYVWKNGNVPYSLMRWELLGDRSDVELLDRWAAELPAVAG